MDREPLVVLLLKIPFKLAVIIKDFTSVLLGKVLLACFTMIITLLSSVHFRKSISQLLVSGVLKVLVLVFLIYSSSYPLYWGVSYILLSDYPYLSIPLILAEIISLVYLFKKSLNLITISKKNDLKQLITSGLLDFSALLITLLVISSIIGIIQLKKLPKPDDYLKFILKALKFTIVNILLIPKIIPLLIFPWRIIIYIIEFNENDTGIGKTIRHLYEGIIDIVASLCFIGVLLGIFEIKHMLKLIKRRVLTRRKVIEFFALTIVDMILLVIAIFNLACMIRAYAFYNGLFDDKGKLKNLTEIGICIIKNFKDTVISPIILIMYLFLLIPYYRIKLLDVGFFGSCKSTENFEIFKRDIYVQASFQLIDLIVLIILIICLPFLHRSIKALLLIQQKGSNWIEITCRLAIDILLDFPTFFMLNIILITVVRIPLMRRRRAIYQNVHIFYLCRNITGEIIKDSLVLPFVLVNLITPWRLYYLLPKLKNAPSPKEQRKIVKADGLRPIEDYATIFLTIILLLSCWRTVEIISIVVTHIRQIIQNEQLTSSLFRKVFRKFLELLIDILMAGMILCIFLLLIEIYNFCRRMRTFYYLYKDRRGFQYKKYLDSICPKKQIQESHNAYIKKINKNVFTNIASFLDVKSLARVSQANKKFKDLVNFPPVWKSQYENNWKKYVTSSMINEIALGDDYKELVKKGYENFTKENTGIILDEEERDYKMGARIIVLEEFVLSIFGFPHIIALPAKGICYLLAKIELNWYFSTPRYQGLGFEIKLFTHPIDRWYNDAVTVSYI